MFKRVLLLGSLILATMPAHAVTMITRGGAPTGNWNQASSTFTAEFANWTQTGSYTSVTVTANLISTNGSAATGNAYILKAAPPTTSGNVVASAAISTSNTLTTAPTTLFTGVTLPAGTYYLVIENGSANLGWVLSSGSAVVSVAGDVTEANDGVTTGAPPAYTDTFSTPGSPARGVFFSVDGTVAAAPPPTGVPALGVFGGVGTAMLLCLAGLLFLKRESVNPIR